MIIAAEPKSAKYKVALESQGFSTNKKQKPLERLEIQHKKSPSDFATFVFSNKDDVKTLDPEKDKLISELKQELVLKRSRISSLEQKVKELTKAHEIGSP